MRILHITGNYPDPSFQQPTTRAVQNLVLATQGDCRHLVASIKRLNAYRESTHVDGNVLSLGYRGLPALIGMSYFLKRLADRLATEVAKIGFNYDIVHAHKLTVEGVVAMELARQAGKPYVTTIRAYTDRRLMKWRPDCHHRFREVLLGANAVFLPAPWAGGAVMDQLGFTEGQRQRLPAVVSLPNIVQYRDIPSTSGNLAVDPVLVTVFRAGQGAAKGFRGVIDGVRSLIAGGARIQVHVIGCDIGTEEAKWAAEAGLGHAVKFLGPMSHDRALEVIACCSGLVLPSRNDTFGMVYVEALLSGVPVLYSANAGIDGFLNALSVGVRVEPDNAESVIGGMKAFVSDLGWYRQNLLSALQMGKLDFFRKEHIVATYLHVMQAIAKDPSGNA